MLRGDLGPSVEAHSRRWELVVNGYLSRFHGSVQVDPLRLGRDAARIAEEIVQHLTGLVGSNVEITIEIQADLAEGAGEKLVRDVTENCRTLRFTDFGFEED